MTFFALSDLLSDERTCRKCGCAGMRACVSPTTGPCWWVARELCSGCSGAQSDAVPPSKQFACLEVAQP